MNFCRNSSYDKNGNESALKKNGNKSSLPILLEWYLIYKTFQGNKNKKYPKFFLAFQNKSKNKNKININIVKLT